MGIINALFQKIEKNRHEGESICNEIDNISVRIAAHNDEVASFLAAKARGLIGDVEGRSLDEQQMKCIVKPVSNHLVIAGAGT